MSQEIRRRMKRAWRRKNTGNTNASGLQLENLERRVLLDVAGFWDELGWRSATGGGISWDESDSGANVSGEAQLVLSADGDPIILWIEGQFNEYVEEPVPFHWEVEGSIYARQYAADVGWWDLTPGSGDAVAIGAGSQLAATSGPDGQIVATWLSGEEIEATRWNGTMWESLGLVSNDVVVNENPDVAVNDAGEIFISYTAMHPLSGQREIVVKKYGYDYGSLDKISVPPAATDLMWIELVHEDVDLFGINDTSGVSNDRASSFDSSITVDAEGRPIVVWASNNFEGNMEIYLKRWDGDSWEEQGLGSASDPDTNGLSGVSNDPGISIQPDVAVAPNGDVIVSWVNWSDWQNYDNPDTGGGKAGVYVKLLSEGSGVWVEYAGGVSCTDSGIAPSLGWYYEPQIEITSAREPLVTWQGWGALERYAVDRDGTSGNPPNGLHTPDLPGNTDIESPIMGVYASYYTAVTGFALLANLDDPSGERANPTAIVDGEPRYYHSWMPTALVGENDELILGYTWRDNLLDAYNQDSEIFVQQWDAVAGNWQTYGRGSDFCGNDVFGGPENSAGYIAEDFLETYIEDEMQLGLIDYDSDPTTEMDVMLANGEHVYLYNRQTDAWSLIDPAGGYGLVFDLRGEPEVEHNVDGSPLLAYINTDVFSPDYGLPFVLQWGGGNWNVVGGGAAFDQLGVTPYDGYPTGITVQAGANGSIFLGYMAFDGNSVDVYTRIWDGTSWSNVGEETEISPGVFVSSADEGSILQPMFYADFDAYNFNGIDIDETNLDNNGSVNPGFTNRQVDQWYLDVYEQYGPALGIDLTPFGNNRGYFDGDNNRNDFPGEVTVDAEGEVSAGPFYVDDPNNGQNDEALVLKMRIEEDEYLGYVEGTQFQAALINRFHLIEEDHVNIEMMYAVDTLNMDVGLYLVLDREIVDVNPNDNIPLSPINTIVAGSSETWEQGDGTIPTTIPSFYTTSIQDQYTTIHLDTKEMQTLGGEPLEPLAMGEHEVILLAVPRVTCPDLGPDAFIIDPATNSSPSIPTDMRFVFPQLESVMEDYYDGWTFVPDALQPTTAVAAWDAAAGDDDGPGVDGGLTLTITDDDSATDYTAWFERSFSLYGGGWVNVELNFELIDDALGASDTLDLQIFLVGPDGMVTELNAIGDYQVTESGGDILYTDAANPLYLSSLPILGALAPGDYTIRVAAVMTDVDNDSAGTGVLRLDDIVLSTTDEALTSDFDENPTMNGWGYEDIDDPNNDVDGGWLLEANITTDEDNPSPGGGLLMEFTDNVNRQDNHGAFYYEFNYGGPVTIEFDYELIVQPDVPADSSLIMLISIDGNYITFPYDTEDGSLDTGYGYFITSDGTDPQTTEPQTCDEFTLAGLDNDEFPSLNALASGPHVIRIEALLEDNGVGGGGTVVATMAIDNFRLYGIDTTDDDVVAGELPDWLEPDPHRVHVRVDNFSVYQRVVPGQIIDDTENLLAISGPFDFDGLGGALPANWAYADVSPIGDADPGGEVDGIQDDDTGAGGIGDGALVMTLGDNTAITEDLEGQFTYSFTIVENAFLDVELDYYLEMDEDLNAFSTTDVFVTLDLTVSIGAVTIHTDQIIASGGGTRTTGWQTLRLTDLGQPNLYAYYEAEFKAFSAGTYDLVVNAALSRSGRDRVESNGSITEGYAAGQAFVKIDNVTITEYQGIGDWEYDDAGGDTGYDSGTWGTNDTVGRDPNLNDNVRDGAFDFGACLHSSLADNGTQRYVIEDVTQWEGGDMVVGFRYRLDAMDTLSISVKIDGVEYNELGENAPVNALYSNSSYRWWNYGYGSVTPEYSYVIVTAENIAAGEHTVSIELNNVDIYVGSQTELYIDNLFILGTPIINGIQPQATLLPTGESGQRSFALGLTSQSPGVLVYENSDDVYPDGPVYSYTSAYDVLDGYQVSAIFELETGTNDWVTYGEKFEATVSIDYFLDIDNQAFPGATFGMPAGEVYILEDYIIGPDAMVWVALQHAEAEWVDIDNPSDGVNDQADIHPWSGNSGYWGNPTILDLAVWRWDPFNDPIQVQGQTESWQDVGFTPLTQYWAYTDVELVGSGGQLPSIGWTGRTGGGSRYSSYVQRYETTGVWGVLGTEDMQNDQYWSSAWLRDMIVREDGMPIVSYYMWHLFSDGVREFRRAETIPSMVISEFSGIPNDGILEFGTVLNVSVDEAFSIFNSGPGDLMVYDIQIGGFGSLASNPFSLFSAPQFPVMLEPGEQDAIIVRFDPTGVPAGEYTAVLTVHTNNITHPTHPFTHFQEMLLTVEVTSGAEVSLNTNFLDYEDTVVYETSEAQEVVISNQGAAPLTIHQWLFDDNNYDIVQAFVTTPAAGGGVVLDPVPTDNIADPDDDVQIPVGGSLTLQIVFTPDDVAIFNETLYIKTNDDDEPFVVVALTGLGVSGAQIVIEENSGLRANDDIIDFGSIVMGTTSDPIPFVVRNIGTTPLEVSDIIIDSAAITLLSVTPPLPNPITLTPGGSTVFYVTYAPTAQGLGDINPIDLETSIAVISDDAVMPTYPIAVLATAVPTIPIIAITDENGVEMVVPRLNFGVVNLGQVLQQTFFIKNEGGADLTLQSFIVNAANTPFTWMPPNTASTADDIPLPIGETLPVIVTFAASNVGLVQNTLEIRSDDRGVPNTITAVILQGAVVNPVLEVTDSYADPNDRFIDFGIVGRNQSASASIVLTNTGDSDITINNWVSDDPAFSIDPTFTGSISMGANQQVELAVTFKPSLISDYNGLITIESDDPTNPSWVVTVAGQGVAPGQVAITDSEIDSPHGVINFTMPNGEPLLAGLDFAQETFTLTNNGASGLVVEGILITSVYGIGAPTSWSAVELTASSFALNIPGRGTRMDPDNAADDIYLDSGESVVVAVSFAPANLFDGQVWATIVSNDPAQSEPDTISHVILSGQSIFARQVGETAGFKQTKIIFYDEDSDLVQVKVTGGGYAVVVLENGVGNGSDIERIELFNTTRKTSLSVISQGETYLGQILGDTVKNINLKNIVLDGADVAGNAIDIGTLTGTLTVDTIINGADIYIGGVNGNGKGAKIKLGSVEDGSDLTVEAPVLLLQAFSYGDGTIQASSMNKLNVGAGDFDAEVVVETDLKTASLSSADMAAIFRIGGELNTLTANKATFTGSLNAANANKLSFNRLLGADLGIREYLRKLTVHTSVLDSRILAGFDLETQQLFSGGEIGTVNVKGQFANSNVAASVAPYSDSQFFHPSFANETQGGGSIGNVIFESVPWDNNGIAFGVSATSIIDKVQAGDFTLYPNDEQVDFRVLLLS